MQRFIPFLTMLLACAGNKLVLVTKIPINLKVEDGTIVQYNGSEIGFIKVKQISGDTLITDIVFEKPIQVPSDSYILLFKHNPFGTTYYQLKKGIGTTYLKTGDTLKESIDSLSLVKRVPVLKDSSIFNFDSVKINYNKKWHRKGNE